MGNILKEANQIINERSEEKERQYGPFSEGMKRAAMIASGMSGKEWSAHDMYIAMVALKFSRQSYNLKEDNLLDAVAYIGAWQNFIDEENEENESERQNNKVLLTEEKKNETKHIEEDDTQERFDQNTATIYEKNHDPRALLKALTGELK
jgi:hypothetical protein